MSSGFSLQEDTQIRWVMIGQLAVLRTAGFVVRPSGAFCSSGTTTETWEDEQGGCSSMVEPQPSKLMMWVRFPSPAPDKNGHGEGTAAGVSRDASRPHSSAVEHFLGKEEVTGSNPVVGSTFADRPQPAGMAAAAGGPQSRGRRRP